VSICVETAVDHYLRVRDFFVKRDFPALLSYPSARNFPLIQALRYWVCFVEQKSQAPLDLSVGNLSLGLQCQLALIWALIAKDTAEIRYQKAANQLAGIVVPLLKAGLTTFNTREEEYSAEETEQAVYLFLKAIGDNQKQKNLEGFFLELEKERLTIVPEEPSWKPYQLLQEDELAMAYGLQGSRAGLGTAHVGALQILAFGLQGEPSTDPRQFGVDFHSKGYVKASAFKKVWVQIEPQLTERQEFSLSMQALGLESDQPLHIVFYLRAASCQIKTQIYKPKSLGKFRGPSQQVRFSPEGFFETDRLCSMELIPLAGEGPFWGASFLLAIQFPLSGKLNLRIAK
jgi:hypothetical protein